MYNKLMLNVFAGEPKPSTELFKLLVKLTL